MSGTPAQQVGTRPHSPQPTGLGGFPPPLCPLPKQSRLGDTESLEDAPPESEPRRKTENVRGGRSGEAWEETLEVSHSNPLEKLRLKERPELVLGSLSSNSESLAVRRPPSSYSPLLLAV